MPISLFKKDSEPDVEQISPEEVEAWAIERAQGQLLWIIKKSAVYGVIGFSVTGLFFWLLNMDGRISLFWLTFYIVLQVDIFMNKWNQKEREYWQHVKNAVLEEPPKQTFLNYEN